MAKKGGKLYPNAAAIIAKQLERPVQRAAESKAADLKRNVSRGPRSGVKYAGLPYQSSAPGEFPQQQSSGDEALVNSIEANPTNDRLRWQVGFFGQPQKKLNALEWGYEPNNLEARAPLQRTMDDNESNNRALEATRRR